MLPATRVPRSSASALLLACALSLLPAVAAAQLTRSSLAGAVGSVDESSALAGCLAGWVDTFGAEPGSNGHILDMLEFDDGSGPALYVAGYFTSVGGVPINCVARWNGTAWSALGDGFDAYVDELAVFDDGTVAGPKLYATGGFTSSGGVAMNRIARFDGSAWQPLGSGLNGVGYTMASHGGALYVGGNFTTAGGVSANRIARWNGSTFSALGSGADASVHAFLSHDDGSGPALYVGGNFTSIDGVPASRMARWNGTSFSDVGGGLANIVWSLAAYDSGSGLELVAGGLFFSAGSSAVPVNGVAAWNGSSWSAPFWPSSTGVEDMFVGDLGSGPVLFMAGSILDGAAAWNGSTLTALGDKPFPKCIAVYDVGSGPELVLGGSFDPGFADYNFEHLARWDGSDWAPFGDGTGLTGSVNAVLSHDDGSGPALFIGGNFGNPADVNGHGFLRWKDGVLDDMGGVLGQPLLGFAEFDDGSGKALYACGKLRAPGVNPFWDVARWDGSAWTEVGNAGGGDTVRTLHVHDDGSGKALYAAGSFSSMNGVTTANIARWDGNSWTAVGPGPGGPVLALESFDDGGGNQLYVGGAFTLGGGAMGDYIVRWDGSTWSGLGGGPLVGPDHMVRALEVFNGFGDIHLYVGGTFDSVMGLPGSEGLARFDASGWSEMPLTGPDGDVYALQVWQDGAFPGSMLMVGGLFTGVGLLNLNNLSAWTGFGWQSFNKGTDGLVRALVLHDADDGLGPMLMVGGDFSYQVGKPFRDSRLARWGGCWAGIDNWTDLGFALGGTAGDPLLVGSGSLSPASSNDVDLSNAYPSALAALFLSFASVPIPFMGGTLVPNPFLDPPLIVTTSATGDLPVSFVMPSDVPPGVQLFVQWGIADPGGPSGAALSNAVRGDVP